MIKNFECYAVYYDGYVMGEHITNACRFDDYFNAVKFYKKLARTYMLVENTNIEISLIGHTIDYKSVSVDNYIKINNN